MSRLTRGNLLATLKQLKKIKRPPHIVAAPAVQAILPSSQPNNSKELQEAISQRRSLLNLGNSRGPFAYGDKSLFDRLTVLQSYRCPYDGPQRGELFIHWFYRDRRVDRLTTCEIFHLNMLQLFNVMDRVEVIHIRCAAKSGMSFAMQKAKAILSCGKAVIDFKIVPQKRSWEHDTFKECVEHAVATGKFVYYTHFKGVTHIADSIVTGSYRNGSPIKITAVNILYWCYVMYRYLFEDSPKSAIAIGPLLYPNRPTLHYLNRGIIPKWSLPVSGHYTGSFQAFDGSFLKKRFDDLGATLEERNRSLWISDPYTVEQFLSLCFEQKEVSTLCPVSGAYLLYDNNVAPAYKVDFNNLFTSGARNICVANGTYKWIGGTDTFNWALCRAFQDLGYTVYYYAPNMDGTGVTEKYLMEAGVRPYIEGTPLLACFANQQSGKYFLGKCPVVQTCHSAFTNLEFPVKGSRAFVSISEEIQLYLKVRGYQTDIIRNGIDLVRYCSKRPLNEVPRVLSICQGDDSLLKEACSKLGWQFRNVPKEVGSRIWHIEDLINYADIVVGIGRSLYDAMACGRACISWDNRKLNPFTGCGYVTSDKWYDFAKTNFTGRGFPTIHTADMLVRELKKYNPADGAVMRSFAEKELDVRKNALKYLAMAGIE